MYGKSGTNIALLTDSIEIDERSKVATAFKEFFVEELCYNLQ